MTGTDLEWVHAYCKVGSLEEMTETRYRRVTLESGIELFHDPDQRGWASYRVDGHWENHPVRSPPLPAFPAADLLPGDRQEPRRGSYASTT